jgi:zona occludens toxin (predicted ATPase)
MSDAPHVPAAFINVIREEGTKAEACDFLQKQWNETFMLKARIAELEARPVRVKPLEWRDSYSVLRADTEFGSYMTSASGKILTLGVAPMSPQMVCANLDDAQAAAQADYERRIKDALETPDDQ